MRSPATVRSEGVLKNGLEFNVPDSTIPPLSFTAGHIAWSIKHACKVEIGIVSGAGNAAAPFEMNTIGAWAAAAAAKTRADHDLYLIGGQLIERNAPGEYGDYITAVESAAIVPGQAKRPGYSTVGRRRLFPSPDRSDKTTIYRAKAKRITDDPAVKGDVDTVKQIRELLRGAQSMPVSPIRELPATTASMFLAETSRQPAMLPVGLMLLDLIEAQVIFGMSQSKTYTIENLMSNPADEGDRLWGGKHPMFHDGTISDGARMFDSFNPVTKKSVSIATAWLYCYAKTHASARWNVKVSREPGPVPGPGVVKWNKSAEKAKTIKWPGLNEKQFNDASAARDKVVKADPTLMGRKNYDFYNSVIVEAFARRCSSLDGLITQHTLAYAQA